MIPHMMDEYRQSLESLPPFPDEPFRPLPPDAWDLHFDAGAYLRSIDLNRGDGQDRAATLTAMFPALDPDRAADLVRGLEALDALPEPEMGQ